MESTERWAKAHERSVDLSVEVMLYGWVTCL